MKKISKKICKKRISVTWFIFSCILFLIFIIQTIMGYYGNQLSNAWGWLLPNILPSLSLIISTIIFDATNTTTSNKYIDAFFYRFTLCFSIFYFICLLLVVVLSPKFSTYPIQQMRFSCIWLGPLQGLTTGLLGIFFVKQESF